jgi:hypothetical protein
MTRVAAVTHGTLILDQVKAAAGPWPCVRRTSRLSSIPLDDVDQTLLAASATRRY